MWKLLLFLSVILIISKAELVYDGDDDALNPIKINEKFLKIPEMTDNEIGQLRKAIKSNQELLLFFYADWCPSCQDFKPVFSSLLKRLFENNGVTVYRINVEGNAELTARFLCFVATVPTLLHIRGGQIRDVSKIRWKLVDYFEGKKWTEIDPWRSVRNPFGLVPSIIGLATIYGQFISKEAGSLQWPRWKWFAVFFSCFALAWGPALYLSLFSKTVADKRVNHGLVADDHQKKD